MSIARLMRAERTRQEADDRKGAVRASAKADAARRKESALEERLDRLALICRALWSFVQESQSLTEEDLLKRVESIDLLDGELDGKVKKEGKKCSGCGRVMHQRHQRCLYCGAEKLVDTVFDMV